MMKKKIVTGAVVAVASAALAAAREAHKRGYDRKALEKAKSAARMLEKEIIRIEKVAKAEFKSKMKGTGCGKARAKSPSRKKKKR